MILPSDIVDGAVTIGWIQSDSLEDRVVMIIKIDYGLTAMNPTEAAKTGKALVAALRCLFNVELSECK